MSSPVLHIKDAYFFELPKGVHRAMGYRGYRGKADFPDVWVGLDDDYQLWEAREHIYSRLSGGDVPSWDALKHDYLHWKHAAGHKNFAKPLDVMLDEHYDSHVRQFNAWLRQFEKEERGEKTFDDFVADAKPKHGWFSAMRYKQPAFERAWQEIKYNASQSVGEYKSSAEIPEWSAAKIAAYNENLAGKVLIPQPFGTLRNLHEAENGFCVSKFMVIQVVVGLLLTAVFVRLGKRIVSGEAPKGRVWNLLETFLVFVRDQVARPAIGHGADKFVPLLWTMFMFVLACNLCGMLPWVGAPTGGFGVTTGLAFITFGTGVAAGVLKFGPLGFFANQVPSMDLPWPIAIIVKPGLLAIELLGLLIKHLVLAIRLLANMVAGHLVLLGIMGLAFGVNAAMHYSTPEGLSPMWYGLTMPIVIIGSTLFSILELFVAFLQAYIFTFLSALFIGAATHHH